MNEQELIKYEVSFLSPREEAKEEVLKVIEKNGGKLLKDGTPVRIRLSYPIKKEESAFLLRLGFEAEAGQVKKISDEIGLSKSILRFFISRFDEKKAENERSRSSIWQSKKGAKLAEEAPGQEIKEGGAGEAVAVPLEKVESSSPKTSAFPGELTNEALEKKLEELLSE